MDRCERIPPHLPRLTADHACRLIDSSDDAIISKSVDGIITSWNKGAEHLFGYRSEEAVGRPVTMLLPPDRVEEETHILGRIRAGEHVPRYDTVRRRKDGRLVAVSLTISPMKDQKGRVVGASKIARDITETKRLQERQKLLLTETRHRIKNLLATVQAIAVQSLPSAQDAEIQEFSGRLQSLARAHELLTAENWECAALADLIQRSIEPFQQSQDAHILCEGKGEAWLGCSNAVLLSMILHELATNAVKYGALSTPLGRVQILWTAQPGMPIKIEWREYGGPRVVEPAHQGFGSRLVMRSLAGEVGKAALRFEPDGVICNLELKPLDRSTVTISHARH